MSERRREKVKEILFAAVAQPAETREAFLARACGEDRALYREICSLLAFHEDEACPDSTPNPRKTRLVPGHLFAGRYRIVELLGRGGMGEVYRARDEVLDTPVALKFLVTASEDSKRRLLDEVRLARKITHPSVCRVYDVGESEGEFFFTMEYVDGEDLSSQLRRFGRLPPAKVLDIARQLCSGLAAAHAMGVLHRDLKPANIMVDSRGRVRITDFGIATPAEGNATRLAAGTLGYMAPEQLLPGGEVSERSDLYSAGLVLYELLTGHPVFETGDTRELLRLQLEVVPEGPSFEVTGVPEQLDRIITRALARDPSLRPPSALDMAAAFGSTDVLAVASAAGLTPSPEVVLRAGAVEGFSWLQAGVWLALTASALLTLMWLVAEKGPQFDPALARPPEVLEERASAVALGLGYSKPEDEDSDSGYLSNPTARVGEGSVLFWYGWEQDGRKAPFVEQVLEASAELSGLTPMKIGPRGVLVTLAPSGRLVGFIAPAGIDPAERDIDIAVIAQFAGISNLRPIDQVPLPPPVFATTQKLFRGDLQDHVVRLQVARYQGKIVYVAVSRELAGRNAVLEERLSRLPIAGMISLVVLIFLLLAVPLAWRNLKRGRSDRIGARRVAAFVAGTALASFFLAAGHVIHPLVYEFGSFFAALGLIALGTVFSWIAYVGLEPAARRYWPQALVAWTRLLRGRWKDPLVGVALLTGSAGGVWLVLLERAGRVFSPGNQIAGWNIAPAFDAASDSWMILSSVSERLRLAAYQGLILLLVLVLVRYLLRRPVWAIAAFLILMTALGIAGVPVKEPIVVVAVVLTTAIRTTLLVRFGLLALSVSLFVSFLFDLFLFDANLDVWYGAGLKATLIILFLLSAGGARLATRIPVKTGPGSAANR